MIYQTEDQLPDVLTPLQLKDYLQVGISTVYELLRAGQLPAEKIGGQWRIRKAAAVALMEGRGVR